MSDENTRTEIRDVGCDASGQTYRMKPSDSTPSNTMSCQQGINEFTISFGDDKERYEEMRECLGKYCKDGVINTDFFEILIWQELRKKMYNE